MRIRHRLLLLVLAVLVPAFFATALGINYVYGEQQRSYRKSMQETTRALALVLDKEIARREAILRALATSPSLDKGDLRSFYVQARQIAPGVDTSIVLYDNDGRQVLNTRKPFGATDLPTSYSARALREKLGPDATVVSDVYLSPVGGQYSFSVQIPVKRGDRVTYYIAMGGFVRQLQTLFSEHGLPPEWLGSIVDRNGVLAARSKDADRFVGKQAGAQILAKILASPEGVNEGASLSGEPVVAFYNRAPLSEWTFVVSVPQAEIRRSAVHAATLMAGVSLVLLGLAVAGALAVGRLTAEPIEALRDAAERLGNGEVPPATSSGIVETDEVAAAMQRAGAEIHNAKAELERRVAEAVAASERSQRALLQGQKLEALGRLTGGIAHDFNNVLQTLTTGLELAYFSSGDARVKASLEASQRAVQRGVELAQQLMAFGRVQEARLETLRLQHHLALVTPLLRRALPSNVAFSIDIPDDLWPVNLDALQFELALLNLTMNSRDAMPNGGTLHISAVNETLPEGIADAPPGDYVKVTIIDSGSGMSAEVLAKAIDPFFTTKSVGKGSGLGLPQVYGFTKQSGGALVLRSAPGTGTSSLLYLPRAVNAVVARRESQATADAGSPGGAILFVEDDPLVRDVVQPALELAGFDVTIAANGEQAMTILEAGIPFDAVFSDIVMPGKVSGIDLAAAIRLRMPALAVILATGYSDRRVDVPDVRVIAKPYEVADVVDALKEELLKSTGS
jgi:signal transduction histidine kinase/CheY-like chemotaxis protein